MLSEVGFEIEGPVMPSTVLLVWIVGVVVGGGNGETEGVLDNPGKLDEGGGGGGLNVYPGNPSADDVVEVRGGGGLNV